MNKRWYDNNPKIRLLVKLIEETDDTKREYCVEYIEEKAKELGLKPENDFDYIWQRREDEKGDFKKAISFLKQFDEITQEIVAEKLIEKLRNNG